MGGLSFTCSSFLKFQRASVCGSTRGTSPEIQNGPVGSKNRPLRTQPLSPAQAPGWEVTQCVGTITELKFRLHTTYKQRRRSGSSLIRRKVPIWSSSRFPVQGRKHADGTRRLSMQPILFWTGVCLFETSTTEFHAVATRHVYSDGGPLEGFCRMVRRSAGYVAVVRYNEA